MNISDQHAPPSISQKHLVKPYYCTATVVIVYYPLLNRVHGPGPYTCKCSQLARSKVGGPCFVFTPPTSKKYKVEPHLRTRTLLQPVYLVPSPYIFSNFIPLDMDTQFSDTNTFKNWPEVCQFEIITLGVALSYSSIMFLHSEI